MEDKYASIFVYKLKQECIDLIKEKFPCIIILDDASLCDAVYLFIEFKFFNANKIAIIGSLLGAYNEVNSKNLISKKDIDKMFDKINKEVVELSVGDLGFLEGFGSVQMCVVGVEKDNIIVKPTSVNMFKPIICHKSKFKIDKEASSLIEYTYNVEIAIDCDIFPNTNVVDDSLFYFILKETLARILYNVHSIIDNVKLYLLNPCPMLQLVGASMGVPTTDNKSLPILSDSSKAQIKVNPKRNYSVINVVDLSREETKFSSVSVIKLIELHSDLENQTSLNPYEIYQLLNRRYFLYKSLLDINLKENPLGEE